MSVSALLDFMLHLDKHLHALTVAYDNWIYVILLLIIFVETGLVIMPFLPGDSLLFAAGSLASLGALRVEWLLPLLIIAAVVGDAVNYWLGKQIGQQAFNGRFSWLNQQHLQRTQLFFDRHGGKAIILARFVPIVRTFTPFVAGVGTMPYGRFALFNVIGAVTWVSLFLYLGYFFGQLPLVQQNFHLVLPLIVIISLLPILVEMLQVKLRARAAIATNIE